MIKQERDRDETLCVCKCYTSANNDEALVAQQSDLGRVSKETPSPQCQWLAPLLWQPGLCPSFLFGVLTTSKQIATYIKEKIVIDRFSLPLFISPSISLCCSALLSFIMPADRKQRRLTTNTSTSSYTKTSNSHGGHSPPASMHVPINLLNPQLDLYLCSCI